MARCLFCLLPKNLLKKHAMCAQYTHRPVRESRRAGRGHSDLHARTPTHLGLPVRLELASRAVGRSKEELSAEQVQLDLGPLGLGG